MSTSRTAHYTTKTPKGLLERRSAVHRLRCSSAVPQPTVAVVQLELEPLELHLAPRHHAPKVCGRHANNPRGASSGAREQKAKSRLRQFHAVYHVGYLIELDKIQSNT